MFAPVSPDPVEAGLRQLTAVFSILVEHAADPVNSDQAFYQGAIPGMLRRLDPYSAFFDPQQFEQLKELEKSTRKGFGTVVSLLPGRVIILQVMPGTPSARSGLLPGDEILGLNGYALSRLDIDQLVQLLTEARQHRSLIDVRRPGNARLLTFTLTPEDVEARSVDRVFHLRPGIGYVRATSFDLPTGRQIREAIEKLGGAALKGLVLDLRNNPGGLMPAALETAALFLQPKQLILSIRGRAGKGEEVPAPDKNEPYSFPLAVLVNGKTASASEIVAGALQDHKRGVILGERSFGKGMVQGVFPLSAGTGLALTTAFYYTPGGRSIQKQVQGQLEGATTRTDQGGIQPDRVAYPEAMNRLRAALDGTGSFTSFATEYLSRHPKVTADFEATGDLVDEFKVMLSQRGIQPPLSEWSPELDWIRFRLKQEILNQALGVEKGDEVEMRRDPVVQAALEELSRT